jgi:hypothetical protein
MNLFARLVASAALLSAAATAQFSCPDDGYLGGVASNVSGTTDKVLTLNLTGSDKTFTLKVERRHVAPSGTVTWEIIEEVSFTDGNNPPVTIPPGCRASIQDTDPSDGDTNSVDGTATLT